MNTSIILAPSSIVTAEGGMSIYTTWRHVNLARWQTDCCLPLELECVHSGKQQAIHNNPVHTIMYIMYKMSN
jgi:hypothetical protein